MFSRTSQFQYHLWMALRRSMSFYFWDDASSGGKCFYQAPFSTSGLFCKYYVVLMAIFHPFLNTPQQELQCGDVHFSTFTMRRIAMETRKFWNSSNFLAEKLIWTRLAGGTFVFTQVSMRDAVARITCSLALGLVWNCPMAHPYSVSSILDTFPVFWHFQRAPSIGLIFNPIDGAL